MLDVHINCSAIQFQQKDFCQFIESTLKKYQIPSHYIVLEITETMLMNNLDDIAEKIIHFKHLGVRIAIDDFGTGFSSLNYLRKLPFSILKIDKHFVQEITHDNRSSILVQSIIRLAQLLKLEVTAEGVETAFQAQYLSQIGCTFAQGYYFSKPLSKARFEAMLALYHKL